MKEDITSFFIFILLPLILSYFFLLVGVNACEKQCTRNIRCEFLSQEFIGLRVDLYTIVDENLCHWSVSPNCESLRGRLVTASSLHFLPLTFWWNYKIAIIILSKKHKGPFQSQRLCTTAQLSLSHWRYLPYGGQRFIILPQWSFTPALHICRIIHMFCTSRKTSALEVHMNMERQVRNME